MAWDAAADWHHAWFTGIVLTAVSRRGAADAAELVFRVFRRQQRERFLPGLAKLGLQGLPPAVAAARYHYLSNFIGGVGVEYVEESPRKAWIRYPPPRWVWPGATICAIPSEVNAAMLRGWHANNGVMLGAPGLGFVCTGQTVDGDPGLEGYYIEHDHALPEHERLRFAKHERMPRFDPAAAPRLPSADWPAERIAKAKRNYAMEYCRSTLQEAVALFGPADGCALLAHAGRLVAMQHVHGACAALGVADFAAFARAMAEAVGDTADLLDGPAGLVLSQPAVTLLKGLPDPDGALAVAWSALFHGALAALDRFARLAVRIGGEPVPPPPLLAGID